MNSNFGGSSRTLIFFMVASLVGIGFVIGRLSAPDSVSRDSDGPPSSALATGVGPRTMKDGVPVGYARTEQGALQAAINFSRALGPDPGESKDSYAAKLRTIASDEWESELQSTVDSWGEGEAEAAPLRFRITEFSNDQAEVALWVAGFINPRNGSPAAVWGRAFLTLVWQDGDWKIAAEDGDAGPWPAPLSEPSTSDEMSQLLSGFQPIEYEPTSLP